LIETLSGEYNWRTFQKDVCQLRERLDSLDTQVDVAYLPRTGDLQFVRGIGPD